MLWLFLAIYTLSVNGQSENFRHYEVEEGLSNNSVICALQDYQGFLWFGTSDGLNRFDGNVFKIFRLDAQDSTFVGNQAITCLFQDRKNRLWVGTTKGLYLYNARNERFIRLSHTKGKFIRTIYDDPKGRLWFANGNNLYRVLPPKLYSLLGEDFILNYYTDAAVRKVALGKDYNITCAAETKGHKIWMGTEQGQLIVYDVNTDKIESYSMPDLKQTAVETLLVTQDNRLLIGCSRAGLLCMDLESRNIRGGFLNSKHEGDEIFVRNILHYQNNEYWVATEEGLFTICIDSVPGMNVRVLSHLRKNYTNPFSLSDNALYVLCKDREGGVWIGSYFGGVNYLPHQPFRFDRFFPQSYHTSFSGNVVREIVRDASGNFWIGTEDAGLNKINFKTGQFKHIIVKGATGVSHSNIHGLLADGSKIYAGTFNQGLDIFDTSGKFLKNYRAGAGTDQLKSNFINAFCKTKLGKILVCTSLGLYYFYPQSGAFNLINELPLNEFYSAIMEDNSGTIWIGTHTKGVYFLEDDHWQQLAVFLTSGKRNNLLLDTRILYLNEDKNNRLWIATENGVYRITNKVNVKVFNSKNGLPSNIVYAMMPDSLNNMWLTTSKGLVRIDATNESVQIYNKEDGILSNQFNYQSVYQDDDGMIYFGNVKGLIRFNPYQHDTSNFVPPLYFTNLRIYNQSVSIGSSHSPLDKSLLFTNFIKLNYLQSTFNLDFAALSYSAPKHLQFFYKIDEMGRNWTPVPNSDRSIYFTHLAPGNYTLRVRSTNSTGNMINNEKVLNILMLPPFWKSDTAYAIYVFLCLLLMVLTIYVYTRYHSQKNKRAIAFYKLQHEKELYESKVNFFTNIAHEIRTPLTLIKGPIDKILESKDHFPRLEGYLDLIERNTNQLLILTQDLLDFRKIEADIPNKEQKHVKLDEWLQTFIEPYKLFAEQKDLKFSYARSIDNLYVSILEIPLSKMINNLLDNALKYADEVVIIYLYSSTKYNRFIIEVKNDGYLIPQEFHKKIFEPFFRWNRRKDVRGSGIGLSVSHSLAEMYGGDLNYLISNEKYNCFQLILPTDPNANKKP